MEDFKIKDFGLDDIDREAMREGLAIRKLKAAQVKRNQKANPKGRKKKGKKEPDVDVLQILNIVKKQ